MTEIFYEILERYGQKITVSNPVGTTCVKAFLQPVADKSKVVSYEVTPLGTVDDRQWICLSKAELAVGDTVTGEDRTFMVQNSVPCYLGVEISHWRAVLSPQKETAE
jgi:hypothetical protein